MSEDEPKSAYELAMEKLRRRDREEGREETVPLTDEQREKIAEVRRECEAKTAELEIMRQDRFHKSGGDPETLEKIEESYRRDRRRIEEERDAKIARIREGRY